MSVDIYKMVGWFYDEHGRLTYSMAGSRNGTDGTADCSGSVTQAIASAGGKAYNYLYSTVTIGAYLAANGFERIAVNQDWEPQFGDVVLMSWGKDMASSGGAGGHVGVMDSATNFISCDCWTGGQANTAVSEHDWNEYYNTEIANGLQYVEVWRYNASIQVKPTDVTPKVPQSGGVDQVLNIGEFFAPRKAYRVDVLTNGYNIDQVVSYDLANGGTSTEYDLYNNGLGVESVDKCDANGNITADQNLDVGDYFRLHSDRIEVVDVDPATNGVAFGTRYGNVWASAATLTEVK